jgi:hypothetical protein
MRKLWAAFFVALSVLTLSLGWQPARAEGSFSYTGSFDFDAFLMEFTEEYPDRSDKDENSPAALYLANTFFELGYSKGDFSEATGAEDFLESFTFTYYGSTYKSSNVVAVKRASGTSRGAVIIGAHYDNVYSFELLNPYTNLRHKILSKGAYDNGSGVTVMMSIAHDLKEAELPFDVVFAAFGAEELGLYGSRHYVNTMSERDKQNTLLMINLDCVAAGDYLYLFSKDWHATHDGWLRERARELSIPLRALPLDKNFMYDFMGDGFYSHYGYMSDSYYFLKENINTAFFMTMNWESVKKAGVVESDLHNDIMHTHNDDYRTLKELYPQTYLLYMHYVSELISYSLKKEDFADAMIHSRQSTLNPAFIMDGKNLKIMSFSAWLALAVICYFYYGKLRKRAAVAIKEHLSQTKPGEVFDELGSKMPKGFSVFGSEFENDRHDEEKDK